MIDLVRQVAEEAGTILMERFGRLAPSEIERRGRRDVVTAADTAAEEHIRRRLEQAHPGIPVIGEESSGGVSAAPAGPAWIVDPLDGTVNYIQGIPVFAVSIGYVEDGVPLLGVIHAPALRQTFWGGPGQGVFEGDRPVSTSITPDLDAAILATGFAYRRNEVADDNVGHLAAMIRRVRGIRRMGAAAIDLAYVASGRLDGFWELHLGPWDMAAGVALVRGAGGTVTDLDGGDDWLFGPSIVAANALLHADLRAALTA
ncbi:MAG: inositol monophosphatase family protein [Planctomycetota bacterium]|nr:inositol monophosphatase family protein [Planctomycetota bacterium]